uniref:Probable dual-specificity RNA methyltransferase RlmN n=1 Tax=candidate division WOR-3 bacterium TaxID=2052148 RepID=A0A7C4CDE9_UNCW3
MTALPDIKSLTPARLSALGVERGWPRYRAAQLFDWLWRRSARSFDEMTNLSKACRAELAREFSLGFLEPETTLRDRDGTVKARFRLDDGETIESVFIPDADRRTICVSTQAGCPLGCRFCYTGRHGFVRNLGWHEIAGQVQAMQQALQTRATNVVFMGMGEPFLNPDAVYDAIRTLNTDSGLGIGARHITVSTVGIPGAIRAFAAFPLQCRLAISLNAADDETRSAVMPVNQRFPLAEVLAAVREYIRTTRRRVTFEYVMLQGINDRQADLHNLARLLKGVPCKLNLIPFNPFPGAEFRPPSPAAVRRFAETLFPLLPAVTVRKSKGSTILAGCGQLAAASTHSP